MLSYAIAIPSHHRSQSIVKKTLKLLKQNHFPADMIHIFVEPSELLAYTHELLADPIWFPKLIPGRAGTTGQRAAIEEYFAIGQRILCMDDDITGFKVMGPVFYLPTLFEKCFALAEAEGCNLWGLHPSDNGLSMKNSAVVGLSYIIGSTYGLTLTHRLDYSCNLTEDFYRTIQHYLHDGNVLRINAIGIKTKYFSEGGLAEYRVGGAQEEAARAFKDRFPTLCRLRMRVGKPTDVVIKTIAKKRLDNPLGL